MVIVNNLCPTALKSHWTLGLPVLVLMSVLRSAPRGHNSPGDDYLRKGPSREFVGTGLEARSQGTEPGQGGNLWRRGK